MCPVGSWTWGVGWWVLAVDCHCWSSLTFPVVNVQLWWLCYMKTVWGFYSNCKSFHSIFIRISHHQQSYINKRIVGGPIRPKDQSPKGAWLGFERVTFLAAGKRAVSELSHTQKPCWKKSSYIYIYIFLFISYVYEYISVKQRWYLV